jgi:predicted peptidase
MKIFSIASILVLVLWTGGLAAGQDQIAQSQALMKNAGRELDANAAVIDQRSGLVTVLHARLINHLAQAAAGGDPTQVWQLAQLDASLIDQLVTQNYAPLASARGLAAVVLPNIGATKRAYPLAVYVPASYAPSKPAPLIIYLHGKGESEADVATSALIETLADASGALIVAPYAGGDDMLTDANISDLYQVLAATESAFAVDKRRVYLAGHSLGGFAAFKALANHPESWTAALVIEGAVAQSDSDIVAVRVKGKPIYLVAGSNDENIKAAYMRQLAEWLRKNGAIVTYYEQPDGTHSLTSVAPFVSKAWRDMLAGNRPTATSGDDVTAPTPVPTRQST